jgi:c-di-GMP-binding flagellar brake protein YcgR
VRFAEHHDYRVHDAAERLALLTELRDRGTPVLMHAPDGHALRTTLWLVDAASARLAFALSSAELSASYLTPLLEADDVTAIAYPGDVKLQFELSGLVLVRGPASAVLQSALPDEMLRIQRRESFRVTPPVSAPVAYLRHPAIPDMSLALRVLDLSLGGCALRLPDDVPPLAPGTRIAGVTIELDVNTRLRVELTLQHLTHLSADGPAGRMSSARVGCEWQLARLEDERALQRWIDQAQVRQRLQQRGAAAAASPTPGAAGAGPATGGDPARAAGSAGR